MCDHIFVKQSQQEMQDFLGNVWADWGIGTWSFRIVYDKGKLRAENAQSKVDQYYDL